MVSPREACLRNTRNDTVVARRVEKADSYLQRLRGLMGRGALDPDAALVILPCNSVHSFFMRFAIDVVFVNDGWQVLYVRHRMQPWRLSRLVRGAKAVIELPAGQAGALDVRAGDILHLDSTGSTIAPVASRRPRSRGLEAR